MKVKRIKGERSTAKTFSPVVRLLRTRSPSAVSGLIVAIVVDSIYGQGWIRSSTHICDEIPEALSPAIANAYSSGAIPWIPEIFRSIATIEHRSPNWIFWPPTIISRSTMDEARLSSFGDFVMQASATLTPPRNKALQHRSSFISAVALTQPARAARSIQAANGSKPSEALTGNIAKFGADPGDALSSQLAPNATATSSVSRSKIFAQYKSSLTAIALAIPADILFRSIRPSFDYK